MGTSMMKSVLLFLILATALVSAQQFQDLFFIDDFTIESPTIVIVIPNGASFPVSDTRTTSGPDANIIGTERNILLTVDSGSANLVLTSGVAGGSFSCATPNEARGSSLIQWDGVDGSVNLSPAGLGSRDFTAEDGFAIRTFIESDIATTVTFRFYSGSAGAMCARTLQIPGDDTTNEYIMEYTSFTNGCDFSNIGAVEIFVEMFDNVDVLIEIVSIYAPIPQTPSNTRTRTRTPTPTPSRSPTPSDTCVCRCPIFVCEVFRVDDGNYYFYNFDYFFIDFFTYFTGFGNFFFDPFFQYFYFFDVPYFDYFFGGFGGFDFYYFDFDFFGFFLPFNYYLFA